MRDWQIGPYNRNNHCSVNSDIEGHRALHLFFCTLKEHKYEVTPRFKDMKFPGVRGFTGVCFDEDICEAILEALLDGETMSKAFDRAADKIQSICEADLEYRQTEAAILENLDKKAEIYTEEGSEF